jgi:hypothetical protein
MAPVDPSQTPTDGDFAAFVEAQALSPKPTRDAPPAPEPGTTLEGVLLRGEEPTDGFIESFAELNALPELSEEELARQALADPGEDGDVSTPE